MFSESVKIDLEDEIDGFERTTLKRLLKSFDTIEAEAAEKRADFLAKKSRSFNPDVDDELCIQEDGYFEEINHVLIEKSLKQEFLNSVAVWLFHLLERQKKRVYGSDKTNDLKPILAKCNYDIVSCPEWTVLNIELRGVANSVKHGPKSEAAKTLKSSHPNLFYRDTVVVADKDIARYISSLREFWNNALKGQVVL